VRYFFRTITASSAWTQAAELGIVSIPLSEGWEAREFLVHILPVWTRQRYNYWLVFHLQLAGICAFPIDYPTVPRGQSRIRLIFHGGNTEAEVDALVAALSGFADEMVAIEKAGDGAPKVPRAAQQVYALMANA
jgi:8-amino-7-oxononanoate synthase